MFHSFCPDAGCSLVSKVIAPEATRRAIEAFNDGKGGDGYVGAMKWCREHYPALTGSMASLYLATFHAFKDGKVAALLDHARQILDDDGHDLAIVRWGLCLDNAPSREGDAIDIWLDDGSHGVAYVQYWRGVKHYYFDY